MNIRKAIKLYLRSNTNLVFLAIYAAGLVLSIILTSGVAIPLLVTAVYIGITFGMLFTKRGATEIVHERDEDIQKEAEQKLDDAAKIRKRLSFLRIPDSELKKALEYFLLVSGQALEACRRERKFLPQLKAELDDVLTVCSAYLKTADRKSIQRRYQNETDGSASPAQDAVHLIKRSASRLDEMRRIELPDAGDARNLDIMKEMDEP
jgi:hypothetical protein